MKIIKHKNDEKLIPITFRLPKDLLGKINELAEKNEISKQKLVTAILNKAIGDKSFKLEIKD